MNFQPTRRNLLQNTFAFIAAPTILQNSRAVAAESAEDPTSGRTLVFNETFMTLDTAIWNAGPKVSTSDAGFYGRSAFARISGEEGFNPYAIVDDPGAAGGKALQISAKYIGRPMSVPNYYGNNDPEYQWISGNLQTAKRDGTIMRGWRQGYFEARLDIPNHPLTWPAFWLMNGRCILSPATSVEVDIIEHKGWETEQYATYLHEWGKPDEHHEGMGVPTGTDITRGFHRYGMLIEGGACTPYFERKPVLSTGTNQPIRWTIGRAAQMEMNNDVFWPLLTLALHHDIPYPNPLRDEDKVAHLRVDYVRVYT